MSMTGYLWSSHVYARLLLGVTLSGNRRGHTWNESRGPECSGCFFHSLNCVSTVRLCVWVCEKRFWVSIDYNSDFNASIMCPSTLYFAHFSFRFLGKPQVQGRAWCVYRRNREASQQYRIEFLFLSVRCPLNSLGIILFLSSLLHIYLLIKVDAY